MTFKRFSLAIAFALLLAACGGGDEATPTDAATGAGEEEMMEESTDEMADEEMADEEMADEEMADEAMTEESMSDEEMSDEETSEEEMADAHLHTFTVTITTNENASLPTPLAPGAFLVQTSMDTLFVEGELDRGEGLEAVAEDGDPTALAVSLAAVETVSSSGVFANPDGGSEAGPALPGSSYSFSFEGVPGDYLTFATMFVQSNDWFFAPASSGIALFDSDTPIDGDISDLVGLWDAGTEVDETPGEGVNQAPRQAGPNTGDAQNTPVSAVSGYEDTITVTIATS